MDNGYFRRRLLLHPSLAHIRAALSAQQAEQDARFARLMDEVEELRAELTELREIFALVTRVTREKAETDVITLRATLEYAVARLQRRDPNTPVH
jgi:hypothetical protein